jgi:hypothetical protein
VVGDEHKGLGDHQQEDQINDPACREKVGHFIFRCSSISRRRARSPLFRRLLR